MLQWGSLANVAQYRVPFAKTLHHLRPTGPVLDWGCGNGHFSFFLTQHGFHSVGLSFDDSPAVLAGEPLFRHVRSDDPVKLPFADGEFPAAVSMGVLEHVHETSGDQRASLVELARVLKPGGTLLVFHLPNTFSWIECLVRQVNPWLRKPVFQHSRLFTRADVERLLPPDLSIVECGRSNIIPRNPANALPAWLRNSRTFVAGLNLLDARSRRSCRCSPKTGSSSCGSGEGRPGGGPLDPPRTPAILHMRSVPQRKRNPTRAVMNAPKPSAEIP